MDYETHRFTGSNPGSRYDRPNGPFGYDDCNGWRGWIQPGWSPFAIPDRAVGDRDDIITQVEALWVSHPGELELRPASDPRPLILTDGPIRWTLTFPVATPLDFDNLGAINVDVGCLPTRN